jgi:hypothetical protein
VQGGQHCEGLEVSEGVVVFAEAEGGYGFGEGVVVVFLEGGEGRLWLWL